MAFKTNKLVVKDDSSGNNEYTHVDKVPGYAHLAANGFHDAINYIAQNLDKPTLCIQVAETQHPGKIAYDENGEIIAAYGWRCIQMLGQGKDGTTFWGCKYGDPKEEKHVVKIKSSYAKQFDNNTHIFNAMLRSIIRKDEKKPRAILDQVVKYDYNHYKSRQPFRHIKPDRKIIHQSLADVCSMNEWCIRNTGFVFWDMGFSNGRNFMKDSNNETRWVDYGGAGMLQCPNFKQVYNTFRGLPVLELGIEEDLRSLKGKESLIVGDSDFVMCQFLLNYEFWSEPETTADLYSSILQVKRQIIPEITELLPKLIKTKLGKSVYNEYNKGWNWCDETTWKSLRKFINANT